MTARPRGGELGAAPITGERVVHLDGPITSVAAERVVSGLLALVSSDAARDIVLVIDSPGGEVKAGLAIYDALQLATCPVATVCIGDASSMAALLLAAGTPGKRVALSRARIVLHEAWDLAPAERHTEALRRALGEVTALMTDLLHRHTGRPREAVAADVRAGRAFTARQARRYGLVDQVAGDSDA